jgi:RNA polymerase sigma-70 factor (ECF subfamily)
LSADVTLVDQSWGTRLETHCTYQTGDRSAGAEAYSLWVTSTDGAQSEVASWQSAPGSTVTPTATTSLAKEQIASVEIRDVSTGQVVLRGTL